MDWELLQGMGLDDAAVCRIMEALAPEKPTPRFVAPAGVGGTVGQAAPANVAQAREMGAQRAASRRASGEVLKHFL